MRRAVTAVVVLALVAGVALLAVWVRDRYLAPLAAGDPPPVGAEPVPRWRSRRRGRILPPVRKPPVDRDEAARHQATKKPVAPAKPVTGVPERPKKAERMTVRYVYDGDTLQLQSAKPGHYVTTRAKIKVRLIGVDAPEMTPKKQCYAQQATDRLRKLAPPGSTVWIAPDKDSWDDYRRRLFHVWNEQGVLIDHDLVAQGYGRAIRVWPNVSHWPVMERAQASAQRKKLGLWESC